VSAKEPALEPAAEPSALVAEAEARREEQHRVAVLGAAVPLLLLSAPLVLPLDGKGPVLSAVAKDPLVAAVAVVFLWPVFVGLVGLLRARSRRAPGTAAFAVPAVITLLGTALVSLLLVMLIDEKRRAREAPSVWVALALCVLTLYVVGRGFRRKGWARWSQLSAGVWMFFVAGTVLMALETRSLFTQLESGGWVWLFALSAAAPAMVWSVLARRR
jgi:hypothetical protein